MGKHQPGWTLSMWLTAALSAVPVMLGATAAVIAVALAHESGGEVMQLIGATFAPFPAALAVTLIYRRVQRSIDYRRHTAALCLVSALAQVAMVHAPNLLTLVISQATVGALTPVAALLTHRVQRSFDQARTSPGRARGGQFSGDRQALVQGMSAAFLIPPIASLIFAGDATPLDSQWRSINLAVAVALSVAAVMVLPLKSGRPTVTDDEEEHSDLRAEPEFRRGFALYSLGHSAFGLGSTLLPVTLAHYLVGDMSPPWLPGGDWLSWPVVALWLPVEFIQRVVAIPRIRSAGRAFDNGTEGEATWKATVHIACSSAALALVAFLFTNDFAAVIGTVAAWWWLGVGAGPVITAGRIAANRVPDPSASSIVSLGGWSFGLMGRLLVLATYEPKTLTDPVIWIPCAIFALIAYVVGVYASARPSPHRPAPGAGQSAP